MRQLVINSVYIFFSIPAFLFLCILTAFVYMSAVILTGNRDNLSVWFVMSSLFGIMFPIGLLYFNSRNEKFNVTLVEKVLWAVLLFPVFVMVRIVINFLLFRMISLLPISGVELIGGGYVLTLLIELLYWAMMQLFFWYSRTMNSIKFALLAIVIELVMVELLYLIPLLLNPID